MKHINPNSLKGKDRINKMKDLMGKLTVNENATPSKVELTKLGPDNIVYGIVRENHKYFIKTSNKIDSILLEDFNYMGGLGNKNENAYGSYSKALKKLNLKLISLNEVYGGDKFNSFTNDNLLKEDAEFSNVEENEYIEEDLVEGEDPENDEDGSEDKDCEVLNDETVKESKSPKFSILDSMKKVDTVSKKKSLNEGKYKLKIDDPTPDVEPEGANNQNVGSTNDVPQDDGGFDDSDQMPPEPGNDEPFDKEPFDAEVEASEEDDPKKFIQQLSGKLGQSLRKFTDSNGVDFELEKFAINSLVSASHTARMDKEDKEDIIEKINTSGNQDDGEGEDDFSDNSGDSDDNAHGASQDMGGDSSGGFDGGSSAGGGVSEGINILDKQHKEVFKNSKLGVDESGLDHNDNGVLSLDDLENMCDDIKSNLDVSNNNSIFDNENLKNKIKDYMTDDVATSPEIKPETKPSVHPDEPNKIPRRRKPYRVRPNHNPKPKANN